VAAGPERINLHASAVAIDGRGCLITGASGSGKSTLAIELIGLGADLVADDRTDIERRGEFLQMSPPAPIAGLIEARGAGLIRMPWLEDAVLRLIVDLDRAATVRLPETANRDLLGVFCPVILGKGRIGLAAILKLVLLHGLDGAARTGKQG